MFEAKYLPCLYGIIDAEEIPTINKRHYILIIFPAALQQFVPVISSEKPSSLLIHLRGLLSV